MMVEATSSGEQGYALPLTQDCYAVGDGIAAPRDGGEGMVTSKVVDCGSALDKALCYLACSMFSELHSPVKKGNITHWRTSTLELGWR